MTAFKVRRDCVINEAGDHFFPVQNPNSDKTAQYQSALCVS